MRSGAFVWAIAATPIEAQSESGAVRENLILFEHHLLEGRASSGAFADRDGVREQTNRKSGLSRFSCSCSLTVTMLASIGPLSTTLRMGAMLPY
jgi:hypothetical protein